MARLLGVDPGEVRIGLAVSDPSGIVARPLKVLRHRSRRHDARTIAGLAEEHQARQIVVGVPLDLEGEAGPQARRALRLAEAIQSVSDIPVVTWDESGTTQAAQRTGGKSAGIDARAAAVILQEYLDAQRKT